MSGMTQEQALAEGTSLDIGATCHAAAPSGNVRAALEGVPGMFAPPDPIEPYESREFPLVVRAIGGPDGRIGGFNLRVSAGTLAPAAGNDTFMQFSAENREATHTPAGSQVGRVWHLVWTSPESPSNAVIFDLVVNAIFPIEERDPTATAPTSEWNRATFVSAGEAGPNVGAAHATRVEDFGVGWLAYWVGIVSFVFLGIVLVVYYVVFRYGETSKATDHRARKGKAK